jgi:Na+/H+ antiporter NhaD/arsenite permease-like protein
VNQVVLAGVIFLITYAVIVSERIHRTLAALAGGMLMILFKIIPQEEAFASIDLNVIFLLAGMMMIAHVMGETGIFQWLAVQAVRVGRGNPIAILVILSSITAIASALLDNVTVVVLIAPVILFIATSLELNPIPFLISMVVASNVGGAATLIGDPPNILIGSAAHISFTHFLLNMGPPILITLVAVLIISFYLFRNEFVMDQDEPHALIDVQARTLIKSPGLLMKSLVVLALVIAGFFLQGWLGIEPATIALGGATLLLIWTRWDPKDVFENIEWVTLLFFVGLFITVEALFATGIIDAIAVGVLGITNGNSSITTIFLLWFSALASGIVDNIPYTATMIPVVQDLAVTMRAEPLWWSLALGADLGGNLTLVGASANVVVASLAERSGHRIPFILFLRYGAIYVVVSLIISTIWVWLRYL